MNYLMRNCDHIRFISNLDLSLKIFYFHTLYDTDQFKVKSTQRATWSSTKSTKSSFLSSQRATWSSTKSTKSSFLSSQRATWSSTKSYVRAHKELSNICLIFHTRVYLRQMVSQYPHKPPNDEPRFGNPNIFPRRLPGGSLIPNHVGL